MTVNKNVVCGPHRDKRNSSESYIAFFGDYESGGSLHLEDGRVFPGSEKGVWHGPFDGAKVTHYNSPHRGGTKWSCVAYSQTPPR